MRTFKFCGIDATGRKGWVYGDLVHNQRVTTTGLEPRVMVGGYEVIPETVGLFTDLKDANGTDIYEGNFISVFLNGEKRQIGRVEWYPNGYFFINDGLTDAANDSFCTLGEMLKKYRFEVELKPLPCSLTKQ